MSLPRRLRQRQHRSRASPCSSPPGIGADAGSRGSCGRFPQGGRQFRPGHVRRPAAAQRGGDDPSVHEAQAPGTASGTGQAATVANELK